jgi:hypothetical protein
MKQKTNVPGSRPGHRNWTRRDFLKTSVAAAAGWTMGWPGTSRSFAAPALEEGLSFFLVADTHYLAQRDEPAKMFEHTTSVNERLIETLNAFPGQEIPERIGGGKVSEPKGVIHLGDMVDTGDKTGALHERMTDTEWRVYVEQFGLTGRDGKLRYPVYEVHGNHDSPRARNVVLRGIMDRNTRRPGLKNVSENGLHYSWDWGNIHFVALGLLAGPNNDGFQIGRYDAWDSLPFLVKDLERNVGDSGRPVILLHHLDLLRYSGECDEPAAKLDRSSCCPGMAAIAWCSRDCKERAPGISRSEWSQCDVQAFYRAVKPYHIAAIFHGHLHGRRTQRWNGTAQSGAEGIPVFGSNNSGAGGGNRSLFYARVENGALVLREYHSVGEHGWCRERSELRWEPQLWRIPLKAGAKV